jgi:uncharacterized membrane protein YdjX (TVP38/TMEM64 family)
MKKTPESVRGPDGPEAPGLHPGGREVLALLLLGGAAVVALLSGGFDPIRWKEFILSFGPWAPVLWTGVYLVAVFIPYATTVMTVTAGLAFGAVWGTVLPYCVTLFASLLPFSVSRHFGRPWVERWLSRTRFAAQIDRINQHAFVIFFYLRLIPSVPYEIQNHIAGVSRLTYREFLLASLLGNAPILFVLAFLGEGLGRLWTPRFWIAVGIYAAALLAPMGVALYRHGRRRE